MTALDRTYKITAVRQPNGPGFFDEIGNGIEITEPRMTASIERSLVKDPNKGEVKLYNLSEDTRAFLEGLPVRVYVTGGYAGDNRLLLVGDVRRGSGSEHDGTEWITTLRLGDGARAIQNARVNHSYRSGTPLLSVLRDVARALHLELPRELVGSPELQSALATGETLSGFAADELTRLLAPFGYSWSVQSGKLQVLRDEQVLVGTERVIEQGDGMIGTPKMKVPTPTRAKKAKKVKRATVEFKHLLDGTLVPGLRVHVRGQVLEGAFKLVKIKHVLDTHGSDWQSECEGIPV